MILKTEGRIQNPESRMLPINNLHALEPVNGFTQEAAFFMDSIFAQLFLLQASGFRPLNSKCFIHDDY